MADYTITAANVVPNSTSGNIGVAGEAIAAGECVYKKTSDGLYYKAQRDGTAEEANVAGIAVCSCSANQPFVFLGGGTLACGSAFSAAGATISVSANAGKLAPIGDVGTGDFISIVGFSESATVLRININATGIEVP